MKRKTPGRGGDGTREGVKNEVRGRTDERRAKSWNDQTLGNHDGIYQGALGKIARGGQERGKGQRIRPSRWERI